ncbi:exported hypothetical protein [Nitrolancea hollandica Lb]|uniref:Uncharacterized protein n=1 Tax=Nitrolancea hollandica Lb TaxID=1129897 RepID=I4EM71_9BACT|nr:exported hypothetical protein [Nitrolancea hollandica Lb]
MGSLTNALALSNPALAGINGGVPVAPAVALADGLGEPVGVLRVAPDVEQAAIRKPTIPIKKTTSSDPLGLGITLSPVTHIRSRLVTRYPDYTEIWAIMPARCPHAGDQDPTFHG